MVVSEGLTAEYSFFGVLGMISSLVNVSTMVYGFLLYDGLSQKYSLPKRFPIPEK